MKLNKLIRTFASLGVFVFLLSGCIVSKQKYDDTLAEKVRMEGERDALQEELTRLKGEIQKTTAENQKLTEDIIRLEKEVKTLKENLKKVGDEKDLLNSTYQNLLSNSGMV